MPHCIIEHSSDLLQNTTIDDLMNAVFTGTSSSQLFEDHDIKIRTIGFDHYRSGTQKESFIHVVVKILDGRTLAQRTQLSSLVLNSIQQLDLKSTSMTVEVIDIEKESYAKFVS